MGMPVVADLRDAGGDHEGALDAVFAWLGRVDETFSTWKESSEVRRLARGEAPRRARPRELRVERGR